MTSQGVHFAEGGAANGVEDGLTVSGDFINRPETHCYSWRSEFFLDLMGA